MTAETKFEPSNVNVRIKISALWTSMLFVFAYVDLFSLYRRDVRADLEAGAIGGFTAWGAETRSSCRGGEFVFVDEAAE